MYFGHGLSNLTIWIILCPSPPSASQESGLLGGQFSNVLTKVRKEGSYVIVGAEFQFKSILSNCLVKFHQKSDTDLQYALHVKVPCYIIK